MKHVVLYSGGIGSWAAAKRVAERHPGEELVLLFTDTCMEDADLYRFLDESARNVGGQLVKIADGRTPWKVFRDRRMLGNTRIDLCSRILKRELGRKWIEDNCRPEDTRVYIGIDWTEIHRYEGAKDRWLPWVLEAPMCDPPLLLKPELFTLLADEGIEPPRLYGLGFAHNNCGGFCVKAGIGHFLNLLEKLPDLYRWHEEQEEAFRKMVGKNVAILRDRRGGKTRPLTLRELRERHGKKDCTLDREEIGGCGCMVG